MGLHLGGANCLPPVSVDIQVVQNIGWGRWYSFKELQDATNGFDSDNVIGEGGYGIVYRGVLDDGSVVGVKNLLNNKGQAEKEFKVEVEAIGKIRHKNLVGLLGYCIEGAQSYFLYRLLTLFSSLVFKRVQTKILLEPLRLLVYEFVDNGNLEEWLHGDMGPISALTWDIHMKIALGMAKGLAYLHEGLEPKVVHRDVKPINNLLDKSWNAKVSDFGLAKLLGSEASHVTTRVMGTFAFVTSPCIPCHPANLKMNFVDWFKGLVASRRGEEVVDPRIEVRPSPSIEANAISLPSLHRFGCL
ncbi:putative receptor-like serine/threonine-protein kinase [Drosera capensis]